MGWTSSFPEIMETLCADASEITYSSCEELHCSARHWQNWWRDWRLDTVIAKAGTRTKEIWIALRQNQQNDMCAQQRLRSAWASIQSDHCSLCAQQIVKGPMFLHADSEESEQTGLMPRMIRVFNGRAGHFVGFVMRWLKYWSHVMRLWYFLSSVNSFFKHACTAIQWG